METIKFRRICCLDFIYCCFFLKANTELYIDIQDKLGLGIFQLV